MPQKICSINELKSVTREIAQRYGVKRVSLFGSFARGEARADSDIDLLIDKGNLRGLFMLSGFHLDLEERLKTHVDVIIDDSLDKKFIKRISKEAIVLYEQ